jgi:hypothetical protein
MASSEFKAMPVFKDHPDWWMLDILDGFGSHFSSPEALEIYWIYKIRQAKEESDTSHVSKFYDQDPTKKDKVMLRSGTAMLRQAASVSMGVLDQWGLVAVGLMAVRSGNNDPAMWIDAARKVSLHPGFRRPFAEWLDEKRCFLQGGLSSKLEDYPADVYPLLSSLWHAMDPIDKRLVMAIVERNGGLHDEVPARALL